MQKYNENMFQNILRQSLKKLKKVEKKLKKVEKVEKCFQRVPEYDVTK